MVLHILEYTHYQYNEANKDSLSGIDNENSSALPVKNGFLLNTEALHSLEMAANYLHHNHNSAIKIRSGYRSVEKQHSTFIRILKREKNLHKTLSMVAPPGFSEHHAGLAIDINGDRKLLNKILPCFGWELSFPKNNHQYIQFEPWHWRFIGVFVIEMALKEFQKDNDKKLIELCQNNLRLFQGIDNQNIFARNNDMGGQLKKDDFRFITELFEEYKLSYDETEVLDYEQRILILADELCVAQGINKVETIEEAIFILMLFAALVKNDDNKRVYSLQGKLNLLGFLDQTPTGFFDSSTKKAVKRAQQTFNFNKTGVADFMFSKKLQDTVNELTLWTEEEIQELEGKWLVKSARAKPISKIVINRISAVKEGSLFIATDHDFYVDLIGNLATVFQKGASLVIVSKQAKEIRKQLKDSWSVYAVKSSKDALNQLAVRSRKNITGQVICVTGSAGKTSTVSTLGQVLSCFGHVYYDEKNRNIAHMIAHCMVETPRNSDFSIYEVAAMRGSMIETSRLIRPDIVVFTGTGNSHLAAMHSQLIVADIKSQLFFGLEPNGLAVINRDDRFFNRIEEAAREFGAGQIITFGEHPGSSVRLLKYDIDLDGTNIMASVFGKILHYKIGLQGRHWAMNTLSILATANKLGIDVNEMASAFGKVKPVNRRGEKYSINLGDKKVTVYNESFNANPLSMKTSIDMLAAIPSARMSRRILVLGDMMALGEYEIDEHIKLAKEINKTNIDLVYACGVLMKNLYIELNKNKQGGYEENISGITDLLIDQLKNNDIVVVKGSRGMGMERIVEKLQEVTS